MPRTVPAAIQAKTGNQSLRFVWLVEWLLASGAKYYSSGQQVTHNGHVYERNRVESIASLTAQYIDRKRRDFDPVNIVFNNLADDQSTSFPFTLLDASQVFEYAVIKIHLYDIDANVAVDSLWSGYSGRPRFKADQTVELSATFLWDSNEIVVPSKSLQQCGFGTLESNRKKDSDREETAIPLVYGVGNFKIRPTIYSSRVEGAFFIVNFIVSGTAAGLPMQVSDLTAANCILFDSTPAVALEFRPGGVDSVPTNLTLFPDGLAHNDIAYGAARFPITEQIKDKLDDISPADIKMKIVNGRPLIDTGAVSENPVLLLKDVLREPNYGLSVANAMFDATALAASSGYVAPKFQSRLELHGRISMGDFVQQMVSDFNGFVTWNGGLIQIGVKTNAEATVATFAASDSGFSGLTIHEDDVEVWEEDSGEIINELRLNWRQKNRQKRETIMRDPTAQARAGGKTVVDEQFDVLSLYDKTQVEINGATILREEQNANLFISFASPLVEGLKPAPGDIIEVRSPKIFNNASNYRFRIIAQPFDTGDEPLARFTCQVYKPAVYDYNTAGIGIDLLRGSDDTSQAGRPPDVTPNSVQIVSTSANDTEGKLTTIRATCTFPSVNLAAERADNIFREPPWAAVQYWCNWTDESPNEAKLVKEVKYIGDGSIPITVSGDFQIDYHKNRSLKVWFVALGHNRSRSKLGWIPDPTKVGALTTDAAALNGIITVSPTTPFTGGDYIIIENETDRVFSKTAFVLELYPGSGGNRTPFFNSVAIAHPTGTEVAVAKESYPNLTLPLTTPLFTYKTVTGVTVDPKKDGVIVRWTDVNAANIETYAVAYSVDVDAGTNINKLGSATPAWYVSDPLAPPLGVFLNKTKALKARLTAEMLGVSNPTVYVRVFAVNPKNNYSPQMSALQSNASLGGDSAPTDAPSTPNAALIVSNTPDLATSVADAKFVHKAFASQADNSKTFAQTGATELIFVFRENVAGAKDDPRPYVIDDLSVTNVEVPNHFTLGKDMILRRINAKNSAGANRSPVASVQFYAGGKVTSLAGITGFAISSVTAIDSRSSLVNYGWTGPTPAPLIARAILFHKFPGDSSFKKGKKDSYLDDESFQTPGPHTDSLKANHPKNALGQYFIRLVSVDGTFIDSPVFNATSQDEDTAAPNNGVAITINRVKLKKGSFLIVDFVMTILQMSTYEKTVIIIHDNNETGVGRRYFDPFTSTWVTAYPDTTQELLYEQGLRIARNELFVGGRTRVYIRIGIRNRFNGGSTTYSPDLGSFIDSSLVAGNSSEPDDVSEDTAAPAAPVIEEVQESYGKFTLSVAAPSTGVNTLLEFQFVMSTQATAPAGNPTVGSEGVQKIKKIGEFRRSLGFSGTLYFYVRARNASQPNLWSAWSAGVSSSNYSRPLDDVIGTNVPTLPQPAEQIGSTSQTGHTLTTFKLSAGSSSSDGFYAGMTLFRPAAADADKVRRVVNYVGATRFATVESAFATTPPNNQGYDLYKGNMGWSNFDQTGTAFATCMRVWLDTEADENVVELFLAGGENAFSLTHIQIQMLRKSSGAIKKELTIPVSSIPVFTFKSPVGYTPIFRVRMRNKYRTGGSDGWSAWSAYVQGYASGTSVPLPYTPAALPPPETDYEDDSNYPTSRYSFL